MNLVYLLIFLSFTAFAQTNPKIEVIPSPKSADDYEHQYKGCLENSECDQVMGLQLSRWKELITKVKDPQMPDSKKFAYLELFRNKYGMPVEFYTVQKSQMGFKPLLFDSPCRNHNPKGGLKILKGTAFLKGLTNTKAIVWRDQTQFEVPIGEMLRPQPVYIYVDPVKPTLYQLPMGDQPLYIKNKELFVLKEAEEFFFMLKITDAGEWKIENADMSKLSAWEDKRSEVACPKDANKPDPNVFGVEFCKSIWHEDLKKNVTVKLFQGCVL